MLNNWAILKSDGKVENLTKCNTYWDVLNLVYEAVYSGGTSYNKPVKLFHNAKEIELPDTLSEVAWRYGRDLIAEQVAATERVRQKHMPEYLKNA